MMLLLLRTEISNLKFGGIFNLDAIFFKKSSHFFKMGSKKKRSKLGIDDALQMSAEQQV